MKRADALSFREVADYTDPNVCVVEAFLAELTPNQRSTVLGSMGTKLSDSTKKVLERFDEDARADQPHRRRTEIFRMKPGALQDLEYLKNLAGSQPDQVEAALNSLGYGKTIRDWGHDKTAQLDDALMNVTGDDLTRLVGVAFKPVMTPGEAKDLSKLCDLLGNSDLRPQTRAKLVGELVDNPLFYKHDELLAAALVEGMDHSELRLFFDTLYQAGKMERFLDAGSGAQTAFRISTLGIGYIFTYDNEKAMRMVASKGWNANELKAEYGMQQSEMDRLESRAHDIIFDALIDPIPVPDGVKQGVRAINSVVRTVKYDKYEDFPEDVKKLATKIGGCRGQFGRSSGLHCYRGRNNR